MIGKKTLKGKMMDEETLRKMAIEQYLQGKEPVAIYLELGIPNPGSSNG